MLVPSQGQQTPRMAAQRQELLILTLETAVPEPVHPKLPKHLSPDICFWPLHFVDLVFYLGFQDLVKLKWMEDGPCSTALWLYDLVCVY